MCRAKCRGGQRCTSQLLGRYEKSLEQISSLKEKLAKSYMEPQRRIDAEKRLAQLEAQSAQNQEDYLKTPAGIRSMKQRLLQAEIPLTEKNSLEVKIGKYEAMAENDRKVAEDKATKNSNLRKVMQADGISNDVIDEINSLLDTNPALRSYKVYMEKVELAQRSHERALSRAKSARESARSNPTNPRLVQDFKRQDKNLRLKADELRTAKAEANATTGGLKELKTRILDAQDFKTQQTLIFQYSLAESLHKKKLDSRYRRDQRLRLIEKAYADIDKDPSSALKAAKNTKYQPDIVNLNQADSNSKATTTLVTEAEAQTILDIYESESKDSKLSFSKFVASKIHNRPIIDNKLVGKTPDEFAESKPEAVSPNRQRTNPQAPRTSRLDFRLSSEDKRYVQNVAKMYGMTASSYLRKQLLGLPVNSVDNDRSRKINKSKQEQIRSL